MIYVISAIQEKHTNEINPQLFIPKALNHINAFGRSPDLFHCRRLPINTDSGLKIRNA